MQDARATRQMFHYSHQVYEELMRASFNPCVTGHAALGLHEPMNCEA